MNVHIFSTDQSCMEIIDLLPCGNIVTCIIVPTNRRDTPKVKAVIDAANSRGIEVSFHQRGHHIEANLPPADTAISWLYSQIIAVDDLNRYPIGILNMHGGKIPEYRGASVMHWAIINGEKELGITWHEIIEEVDAGPIWAESTIGIPPEATASNMRTAMIDEGQQLFPQAWTHFMDSSSTPRYPNLKDGHVWRQRKPSDGQLGKLWTEQRARDLVRALCPPWPPAFIYSDNEVESQTSMATSIPPLQNTDAQSSCLGKDKVIIENILTQSEPGAIPYLTAEGRTIFLRPVSRDQSQ